MQSPLAKTRLLGFVSKLGLTSKTKETTRQHLFGQISSHVIALKGVITASIAKTVSGVQNQWYRMAVGDTNLDRTLCIALGYFVIIGGAGVYLNYTQNRPAREAGAAIRNHIKHNFVMVKVSVLSFIVTLQILGESYNDMLTCPFLYVLKGRNVLLYRNRYFPSNVWIIT